MERASQEEQHGANFNFVAPSSEELGVLMPASRSKFMYGKGRRSNKFNVTVDIVHGFRPKSENFDPGKKGCHLKEHLMRNRIVQISAS